MDHSAELELDLSALELDDFEVAAEELTIEALTAGHLGEPTCCHYCACPCICVV